MRVTTPTGHTHLSVAPPVLPGAEEAGPPRPPRDGALRARVVIGRNGVRFGVHERDDVEVELAPAG
ncbi:hypothetical protein [Terrabacter terrigena]|uniref:Uncharacterized protein n=1 Tax=Terrabacter terrigena TaxID=574718 RepID=A0ABW3MUL2_9MICO